MDQLPKAKRKEKPEAGAKTKKKTSYMMHPRLRLQRIRSLPSARFIAAIVSVVACLNVNLVSAQSFVSQSTDPRPTIYSGDVSFALLLSAHASTGAELSSAASEQATSISITDTASSGTTPLSVSADLSSILDAASATSSISSSFSAANGSAPIKSSLRTVILGADATDSPLIISLSLDAPQTAAKRQAEIGLDTTTTISTTLPDTNINVSNRFRRQIFESRPRSTSQTASSGTTTDRISPTDRPNSSTGGEQRGFCVQAQPSALYAGMAAIWSSHQANLVGDSSLNVGSYVYDSCADLDVGQRQAVRIVSNLNAFQQTTCEAPRGSPISLTIAHGDNQLRAIQLLTSFRVPVIATRNLFELADELKALSGPQRAFLFSTAPSMRHLAVGALRFSRRVVAKAVASPKLPNQFARNSPRNGLIVVSRNLPTRFVAYIAEVASTVVNFELLQSYQPLEQIKSRATLETILTRRSALKSSSPSLLKSSDSSKASFKANNNNKSRRERRARAERRTLPDDSTFNLESSDDAELNQDQDQQQHHNQHNHDDSGKILSPTILMFITRSEAIDLMTRLRNDLADVSKYYSLIVATSEDITSALKTIFHHGGSSLCAGKSLYTISPRSDDLVEFNRYFRDTASLEGDTSDHPLICEYAKYQTTSRRHIFDVLDDTTAEPVVKAVWSAAAAFKAVHKTQCGSSFGAGFNISTLSSRQVATSATSDKQQQTKPQQACVTRMNKNLAVSVQRALKRLDVTINSTGLKSLDGFRIKFDELNELETNRFSLKHINKECEITELGTFSGSDRSKLFLDEDAFSKSLESALPEPWPQDTTVLSSSSSLSDINANKGQTRNGDNNADSQPKEIATEAPDSDAKDADTSAVAGGGGDVGGSGGGSGGGSDSESTGKDSDGNGATSNKDSNAGADNDTERNGSDGSSAVARAKRVKEPTSSSRRNRSNKRNKQQIKKLRKSQRSPITATMGSEGGGVGLTDAASDRLVAGSVRVEKEAPGDATSSNIKGSAKSDDDDDDGDSDSDDAEVESSENANKNNDRFKKTTSAPFIHAATPTRPMRQMRPWPPLSSSSFTTSGPQLADVGSQPPTTLIVTNQPVTTSFAPTTTAHITHVTQPMRALDDERIDADAGDLRVKATTQAPHYALPAVITSQGLHARNESKNQLDFAASSTESSNVLAPSRVAQPPAPPASSGNQNDEDGDGSGDTNVIYSSASAELAGSFSSVTQPPVADTSDYSSVVDQSPSSSPASALLRDLKSSPEPLSQSNQQHQSQILKLLPQKQLQRLEQEYRSAYARDNRSKLRSHLKWIYSSWFALSILIANISGALLTLYVLTFLLMKNCDGSLNKQSQGLRSIHLLAIIVTFFGSTLFIVYPTPGLCLLRASWHNISLVFLFGSLLLHCMELESAESIGLGGRPNRLNQVLTLMFIVGVQIALELQRWKYESPDYLRFVGSYLNASLAQQASSQDSASSSSLPLLRDAANKKFLTLSENLAVTSHHFNPLNYNSLNEQLTPVSLHVSEQYQTLLHEYCVMSHDEFLQSQIYLCLIVGLLLVYSFVGKARGLAAAGSYKRHTAVAASSHHPSVASRQQLVTGKMVASQHEANLNIDNSLGLHYSAATSHHHNSNGRLPKTLFAVTIASVPIYALALLTNIYFSDSINRDVICCISMVVIAFSVLTSIFLPIMLQLHQKYPRQRPTATRAQFSPADVGSGGGAHDAMFSMFSELANAATNNNNHIEMSSGSNSGSSSGAGSRKAFAETKKSREKMGAVLAHIEHSADSLRDMGVAPGPDRISPAELNLKLNMTDDQFVRHNSHQDFVGTATDGGDHSSRCRAAVAASSQRRANAEEALCSRKRKKLIMIDVDPRCPRHGCISCKR